MAYIITMLEENEEIVSTHKTTAQCSSDVKDDLLSMALDEIGISSIQTMEFDDCSDAISLHVSNDDHQWTFTADLSKEV